jgi:hypothetical protein
MASKVGPARQDVEAVEADAEAGVVGGPHDAPRVVVLADVPAPGQRLVGDAQAAGVRAVGERAQLLGGESVVVDRLRGDVRADEHRRRPELLHQVELGLGPAEVAPELLRRDRLEVAERLVEVDRQPERVRAVADLGRRERRGEQVGLEQLDAVEAGRGGGDELLLQRAAQAHGGDRAAHVSAPPPAPARARPARRSGAASAGGPAARP